MNDKTPTPDEKMKELFGETIFSYTRAEALADGVLIDVSEIAEGIGFKIPTAINERLFYALGGGTPDQDPDRCHVELLLHEAGLAWADRKEDDGTPGGNYGFFEWLDQPAVIALSGGDDGNAVFSICFLAEL